MAKSPPPPDLIARIRSAQLKLKPQNFYERLGLRPGSDARAVRKAYATLASQWHPDRYSQFELGPDEATLSNVFALLTEANATLGSSKKREEYDAALKLGGASGKRVDAAALFEADSAFRLGQQLLERGNQDAARDRFMDAFELNPDSQEFRVYLAYSEFLHLDRNKRGEPIDRQSVERAKEEVTAAIEQLEAFDMGHFFMGRILLDEGRIPEAKRSFQQALYINSKNVQAQRQLRLINMRGGKRPSRPTSRRPGGDDGGTTKPGGFFDKILALFKKK